MRNLAVAILRVSGCVIGTVADNAQAAPFRIDEVEAVAAAGGIERSGGAARLRAWADLPMKSIHSVAVARIENDSAHGGARLPCMQREHVVIRPRPTKIDGAVHLR